MASDVVSEESLIGRLRVVHVPPSSAALVEEARLTLEAVRQLAVQGGYDDIVKTIDEGVRE